MNFLKGLWSSPSSIPLAYKWSVNIHISTALVIKKTTKTIDLVPLLEQNVGILPLFSHCINYECVQRQIEKENHSDKMS